MASHTAMSSFNASGLAFGKRSEHSWEKGLRAIIPLSSILTLMDRVLASALDRKLSTVLPARPGFFEGGRPKTQALDIGHAATLLIDKALDMKF